MDFLARPAAFAVGLILLGAVTAVRRSPLAQRLAPDSRELLEDLRASQISLSIFLAASAWHFVRTSLQDAHSVTIAMALVRATGEVALLRFLELSTFAALHLLRIKVPSRIMRSVSLWIVTAIILVVNARSIWQLDLASLLTTSALLSVVLGFALQEPLGNLFAGLTLNAELPFEAGDWISFDKFSGRVLDVGWRSTRLVTIDEDELLVPNGFISRVVVVNHSRPSSRRTSELLLTVDMEGSPAEVKRTLLETARAVSGVLAVPAPTVLLVRFEEHGVLWKLRFSTGDLTSADDVRDRLQQALWYALRRAGLELPHNQLAISRRERPAEAEARRRREHLAEAEELLGRIDFLASLRPEARAALAQEARFLEYGPGEAVVRQGEPGHALYLVAHGELSVRIAGHEQEVGRLGRGDFFGEVALLTGEPRTATVVSLEDAALLSVERDAFAKLFAADENVMAELAHAIANRKAAIESAREQLGKAPVSVEAQTLLKRIRGLFDRTARIDLPR